MRETSFAASPLPLTEPFVERNIKGLHCGQVFALGGTQTQQLASRLAVSPWVHLCLPGARRWKLRSRSLPACVCMSGRLVWYSFYFFLSIHIYLGYCYTHTCLPLNIRCRQNTSLSLCEFRATACSPGRTGSLCFCAGLGITSVAKCASVFTCVSGQDLEQYSQ